MNTLKPFYSHHMPIENEKLRGFKILPHFQVGQKNGGGEKRVIKYLPSIF